MMVVDANLKPVDQDLQLLDLMAMVVCTGTILGHVQSSHLRPKLA